MADFVTAVKYKLPIKIVVVKNNTLGQIKWEQVVFLGNLEYGVELQPIDFSAFAHACGGAGYWVEDPEDCGHIVEEFLNVTGPAVLEAVVDPLEPVAGENHRGPDSEIRRITRTGRTESEEDCANCALGQSSRDGLEVKDRQLRPAQVS